MLLVDVKKNQTVIVDDIICDGTRKQRILDLGLHKGVGIMLKRVAPLGDPLIIEMGDIDIAIRKNDAQGIVVSSS